MQAELTPLQQIGTPVIVSSVYLYPAAEFGVTNAVDCGWYFDHSRWTNDSDLYGMERLKPAKLVLTQFDYYRSFVPVLDKGCARSRT